MKTDILSMHNRQRARRTAQSPMDYACPITVYKRPASWASRILFTVAAVLLLAAWRMQ